VQIPSAARTSHGQESTFRILKVEAITYCRPLRVHANLCEIAKNKWGGDVTSLNRSFIGRLLACAAVSFAKPACFAADSEWFAITERLLQRDTDPGKEIIYLQAVRIQSNAGLDECQRVLAYIRDATPASSKFRRQYCEFQLPEQVAPAALGVYVPKANIVTFKTTFGRHAILQVYEIFYPGERINHNPQRFCKKIMEMYEAQKYTDILCPLPQ
jgi:hypothetical protein